MRPVPAPHRDDPNVIARLLDRIDHLQRSLPPAAFLYGVVKKFGDDRGGSAAALISYYTFFSLFPLLMVGTTILGWVLQDNPTMQQQITDSALARFPIVGDQIAESVGSVHGSGLAFGVGLFFALWAGLGATEAVQEALHTVFSVPVLQRPPFVVRKLRGVLILVIFGALVVAVTVLGSIGITQWFGPLGRLGWVVVQGLLNAAVIGLLFVVLAGRRTAMRPLVWGAVVGGIGWTVLQFAGGTYVSGVVTRASRTYGLFAVVIGLLSWIYLQAQILLYAAEVASVADVKLWPRALVRERPTAADIEADRAIRRRERRLEA